jgi:CDP-glucose 4,6-dehydratase
MEKKIFGGIFQNKTVFLTGHTGFIGSWMTFWLLQLGCNVIGYSLKSPSTPSLFKILDLKNKITHIHGDINNKKFLEKKISKYEPDFLFHLAAQSLVRKSYDDPANTFQTNVMGTVNILESIKNSKSIRNVVIMTSDKSYENHEKTKFYKENDPLGGTDPYSASKSAAEIITNSYRKTFFNSNKDHDKIGLSSIRAGNVIGGGDWSKDRIVPDCVHALKSKKSILVRNPNSIRPFQFVLEPISAILCVSAKMQKNPRLFSNAWNVGPPKKQGKIQVKKLVPKIIKEWGEGKWLDVSSKNSDFRHESKLLMLDSTKIKKLVNWSSTYTLDEALTNTINWYKNFYDRTINMQDFTLMQIENYVKKAKELNMDWLTK